MRRRSSSSSKTIVVTASAKTKTAERAVKRQPQANLYVMNLGHGAFKIGRTRCVSRRMRQLKVGSLQKITLAQSWSVPRTSAHTLETALKRKFARLFAPCDGGTEVFYGNIQDACQHTARLVRSGA
jgi:hypothetical protein